MQVNAWIKRRNRDEDLEESKAHEGAKRISDLALEDMTDRDWRIFRENHDIIVRGNGVHVPDPIRHWKDVADFVPSDIMRNIERAGFKKPTPI